MVSDDTSKIGAGMGAARARTRHQGVAGAPALAGRPETRWPGARITGPARAARVAGDAMFTKSCDAVESRRDTAPLFAKRAAAASNIAAAGPRLRIALDDVSRFLGPLAWTTPPGTVILA